VTARIGNKSPSVRMPSSAERGVRSAELKHEHIVANHPAQAKAAVARG
jgi:hypothetical protein